MAEFSGSFKVNLEEWLSRTSVKFRFFFQAQVDVAELVFGCCRAEVPFFSGCQLKALGSCTHSLKQASLDLQCQHYRISPHT
jgi:hypothetical protein